MVFGFKKNAGSTPEPGDTHTPPAQTRWDRFKKAWQGKPSAWGKQLAQLGRGKAVLTETLRDTLEQQLLIGDVGIHTTMHLMAQLESASQGAQTSRDITDQLRIIMRDLLQPCAQPFELPTRTPHDKPYTILMVGINGAGKTTTLGKLAHQFSQTHRVLLAAGDTYRAAAVEQLKAWSQHTNTPIIANEAEHADSASVIYDAMQAAAARGCDILLADTAGRLHTQGQLMQELIKIKRVMQKADPDAPHEIWLVLDASVGQNALQQLTQFNEALGITGLVMTKLDGTAKGGVLLTIAHQYQLPIRYIGVGEQQGDILPFNAEAWVDALFHTPQDTPS